MSLLSFTPQASFSTCTARCNILATITLLFRTAILALCLSPAIAHAVVDMSVGRSDVAAYSGSFKTNIPIAVAPGRAGLQPSLSLQYTSGMGDGLYGMGWQLDIARIERSTKGGAPGYTDNDVFVLIMKGAQQTLVKQAGGEFRVRNEGAFLRIRKQGNGWLVQDKSGTKYFFGLDDAAQQSFWPTSAAQAYSWHLSKVLDMNGNVMRFFYLNDNNGQRISHIDYAPGNKVVFSYEARKDVIQSYRSGYLQRTGVRLKTVKSYASNVLAQHLELVYGALADDARSLLTQVIRHDSEGKLANRVTRFSYAKQQVNTFTGRWEKTPEYVQTISRRVGRHGKRSLTSTVYRYADMNGDGRTEILYLNASILTVGYGAMPNTPWVIPEAGVEKYCARIRMRYGRYAPGQTCITPAEYQSFITMMRRVYRYRSYRSRMSYKPAYYPRALVDMNGDGLPDWAVKTASGVWHVYLNNGSAFDTTAQVWADPSGGIGNYLLDVNGDGLPDLLDSSWTAYLNMGDHFAARGVITSVSAAPYAPGRNAALLPANPTDSLTPVLTTKVRS